MVAMSNPTKVSNRDGEGNDKPFHHGSKHFISELKNSSKRTRSELFTLLIYITPNLTYKFLTAEAPSHTVPNLAN
jgi:hypothetical protein